MIDYVVQCRGTITRYITSDKTIHIQNLRIGICKCKYHREIYDKLIQNILCRDGTSFPKVTHFFQTFNVRIKDVLSYQNVLLV